MALTAGSCLFACSPAASAPSEPILEMEAVAVFPVSEAFSVRGGAFANSSTAVVWGRTGLMVMPPAGEPYYVDFNDHDPIDPRGMRILGKSPINVELVDRSGAFLALQPDGTLLETARLQSDSRVKQGVAVGNGWFVNTEDPSDSMNLWGCLWAGEPGDMEPLALPARAATRATATPSSPDGVLAAGFRLTGTGSGAYATELAMPFRTWRLSSADGGQVLEPVHATAAVAEAATRNGFAAETTVALSAIPLDSGYLIQLSDVTSDRRLILLLDSRGALLRAREIDVAVGFMAAHPQSRLLLGLRDTGNPEIVIYRWRWSE